MSQDFGQYKAIAQAICLLLAPHAEVVIHDLKTGLIEAVFNNISKRKVGDESLLELDKLAAFPDVFPPYCKVNWDGRKIKSISATLRDSKGKAVGLLCINLDVSKWEEMHQFILGMLQVDTEEKPEILFNDDWREKINVYVTGYLKKNQVSLQALTKEKKQELVHLLHREGAFQAKNAAAYIAEVLKISRATIYNYLKG